ncbi:uncharacterized protein LOC108115462 [Drosophila eugracilis]|uniref:uncharacterized protein LOC108115462 n=2 Tax=Drosophila eugracilis TaxID=29029 RepID=UPI0007E78F79|nr:uncharacterized protein LOC108115462 [Drosophila eugracilis]
MKPKSKNDKPSTSKATLSTILKKSRDDLSEKLRQAAAKLEKGPSPGPSRSKEPTQQGFRKGKMDNDRDRLMYMNSITMLNDGMRKRIEQFKESKIALVESNARLKLEIQDLTQRKKELDQIHKENSCPICLSRWHLDGDHFPMSLKCGHVFGAKCIFQHLGSCFACPTCRQPVYYNSLRSLYPY